MKNWVEGDCLEAVCRKLSAWRITWSLLPGILPLHKAESSLSITSLYSAYFMVGIIAGIALILLVFNFLLRAKVRRLSSQVNDLLAESGRIASGQESGVNVISDVPSGRVEQRNVVESISSIHEKEIESLAKLASSLSHDLNNLVGNIIGYASLLKKKLQAGSKEFHYADVIESSSRDIAELVRRVLGFSQMDAKTVGVVDVNQFVKSIVGEFGSGRGEKYNVAISVTSEPCLARISTSQLKQVLLAILDNAADAMKEGGTIECLTGLREKPEGPAGRGETRRECFITIEDHGTGMDAEVRQRIFEPFFTTKAEKRYVGLSLSQVFNILKRHDGSISVDSSPGVGTKVMIYLPLYASEKAVSSEETVSAGFELKGAKILVVDDEESVRQLGIDILTEHDFQVVTANDGLDALAKLKENPDVRLVVLDMIMPVMAGKEACIEIKKMKNPPKILICTGFSELADLKTILGTYAESLLQKPYSTGELVAAVENLLKGSTARIG